MWEVQLQIFFTPFSKALLEAHQFSRNSLELDNRKLNKKSLKH